jgi:PKD repeat protein
MTQKVYQFTKPTAGYTKVEGSCDNDEFSFNNETKVASGLFGSYWNFDDNGAISTDANATHDFNTSGDKRVKLVVTSEFGCKDSITKTIQVKESPKAAYINGPLCSVKPTDFTNTTPNVANAVPQYTWDFGDGTTSGAKSPTKDWKGNLGPKKVTLTVTLDNGCTQTVIKDLVVLTQPTPNFAAEDVCAGDDVIFVNNTTWAQGEIKYKWDFGDGTTSANSDPTKKYNTSVTLTPFVTLYAYINGGCGDSITKNITINETPRTCDFVAEPDYSYGFYGMKVDPINNSGVVGGQNDVKYVWVFEGGGSQQTSGKNATAFNNFATDGEYKITMRATMIQTGCECSISKKVVMNRSSVEDLQNGGVAVYPNPSSGVFTVATSAVFGKGSVIEVMNMNGAVVKRMDSMGGMTQVEASELSSGMYLVKVSNGTQSVTRKVNIQN